MYVQITVYLCYSKPDSVWMKRIFDGITTQPWWQAAQVYVSYINAVLDVVNKDLESVGSKWLVSQIKLWFNALNNTWKAL